MHDWAIYTVYTISKFFGPTGGQCVEPMYVVAAFLLANLGIYFFTRGKEFAIVGVSSLLFLVPYIHLQLA